LATRSGSAATRRCSSSRARSPEMAPDAVRRTGRRRNVYDPVPAELHHHEVSNLEVVHLTIAVFQIFARPAR